MDIDKILELLEGFPIVVIGDVNVNLGETYNGDIYESEVFRATEDLEGTKLLNISPLTPEEKLISYAEDMGYEVEKHDFNSFEDLLDYLQNGVSKPPDDCNCECENCECEDDFMTLDEFYESYIDNYNEEDEEIYSPTHYTDLGFECLDLIEHLKCSYNEGNFLKYVYRAGLKTTDTIKDFKKAKFYAEELLQNYKDIEYRDHNVYGYEAQKLMDNVQDEDKKYLFDLFYDTLISDVELVRASKLQQIIGFLNQLIER